MDNKLVSQVVEAVRRVFATYKMDILDYGPKGESITIFFGGPSYFKHNFRLTIDLVNSRLLGEVLASPDARTIVDVFEIQMSSHPLEDIKEIAAYLGNYAAKPVDQNKKNKIMDKLTMDTAKELDQKLDEQDAYRDMDEAKKEDERRDLENASKKFSGKLSFMGNRRDVAADIAGKRHSIGGALTKVAGSGDITTQNVGIKAVSFVRSMLDAFHFPNVPELSYSGMRGGRVAANSSKVEDGVITVNAEFRTASNIGVSFDIPVEIHNGKLLEPSVIVHEGKARVIAQSTFSDIVDSNSIKDVSPVRDIYSAPLDKQVANSLYANRWKTTRVDRGMFSVDAAANEVRKAMRGQSTSMGKVAQVEIERARKLVQDLHNATEQDNEQLIQRILEELDKMVQHGALTQDDINNMAWEHRNYLAKEAAEYGDPSMDNMMDAVGPDAEHDTYGQIVDQYGSTYATLGDASRTLNIPSSLIKQQLDGKADTAKGFVFKRAGKGGVPGPNERPRPSKAPGAPKTPSALKPPSLPKLKNKPSLGKLCSKCNHAPCICPNKRKKGGMDMMINGFDLSGLDAEMAQALDKADSGMADYAIVMEKLVALSDKIGPLATKYGNRGMGTAKKYRYMFTGLMDDLIVMMQEYNSSAQGQQQPAMDVKAQFNVHESSEDIIAKVNEEVGQMKNDGLGDIDIKLAVSKKYGDAIMNAVFEKTAAIPSLDPDPTDPSPDDLKRPLTLDECKQIINGRSVRNCTWYQVQNRLTKQFEPDVPSEVINAVKEAVRNQMDYQNYLWSIPFGQ